MPLFAALVEDCGGAPPDLLPNVRYGWTADIDGYLHEEAPSPDDEAQSREDHRWLPSVLSGCSPFGGPASGHQLRRMPSGAKLLPLGSRRASGWGMELSEQGKLPHAGRRPTGAHRRRWAVPYLESGTRRAIFHSGTTSALRRSRCICATAVHVRHAARNDRKLTFALQAAGPLVMRRVRHHLWRHGSDH